MKYYIHKLNIVILISCTILLFGCGSVLNSQQEQFLSNQSSLMNESNGLTVQTVEFHSKLKVSDVGVGLFDFVTKEKIASSVVDKNGIAIFDMAKENQVYEVVVYRIDKSGEWMDQTRKPIVYKKSKPVVIIETFNTNANNGLAVPVVKQKPELPNGCEVTSLTAILNYYGIDADKVDLAKNYLPKESVIKKHDKIIGPDPNISYAGDPSKTGKGYYVFAPPIVDVANQVLFENNSEYKAMDLSGSSREEIIGYVKSGVPVLAWITIDLKKPRTDGYWTIKETNKKHSIFMNLHAVVLTGYSKGKVTVMNPLTGYEKINADQFFKSFDSLGSHAIVIL